MIVRVVVKYTRYSSGLQRPSSCLDQERQIDNELARRGIDTSDAVVISDEELSGHDESRPGFQRLLGMIRRKEVAVLAVDDQARLSRGDKTMAFIRDLVYAGGRFISVSEVIDTAERGWGAKVKFAEMHHGMATEDHQHRVFRGQEGRVLSDGSAGDFCYGYRSFYIDPEWEEKQRRRGPKPEKGVEVCEAEAVWVRQAFAWFNAGWSIGSIARELTVRKVDKGGRASTPGWNPQQIRRLLANQKYIGIWVWGRTKTLTDSNGNTKQVPVPAEDHVVRERPGLRIVDQREWDLAAAKLEGHGEKYGKREGQKPRGPKQNPAGEYPRSALGGVLTCGKCGSRLHKRPSIRGGFYSCPAATNGLCDMKTGVPAVRAEEELTSRLLEIVLGWPDWMRTVYSHAKAAVREAVSKVPEERDRDEKRLSELDRIIGNVTRVFLTGFASEALKEELQKAEVERKAVRSRLAAHARAGEMEVSLPDDEWVAASVREWAPRAATQTGPNGLLQIAIGSLRAEGVVARGKARGFSRLRMKVDSWGVLAAAMGDRLPEDVRKLLPKGGPAGEEGPEFVVDFGEPTKMDRWAPDIARWREEGVIWKEIVERTGLNLGNAFAAWKRFTGAADERPTAE